MVVLNVLVNRSINHAFVRSVNKRKRPSAHNRNTTLCLPALCLQYLRLYRQKLATAGPSAGNAMSHRSTTCVPSSPRPPPGADLMHDLGGVGFRRRLSGVANAIDRR